MDQRHRWFREGARTFRQAQRLLGKEELLPTKEDLYACPLCLQALFLIGAIEDGDLTVEHAPPAALGGKKVALTCRRCNNDSGRYFDAEAEKQERLRSFLAGERSDAVRVSYSIDGIVNHGNLHILGSSGIMLTGVPRANNPAKMQRFEEALRAKTGTNDIRFSFTPRMRVDPDRARISWVRSAYVVAFAALGWRYILQTALNPLRAQFLTPGSLTIPDICLYDPEGDPSYRALMIVESPADCESILVQMGRHSVFLPAIDQARPLAELAASLHRFQAEPHGPARFSISGKLVPWPTQAQYLLDPA